MAWFRAKKSPKVHWALDVESTGLDVKRDHILSIGMVPIRDGAIRWGERAYWPVRPPGDADGGSHATTIHALLPDELAEAEPPSAVLPEIAHRLAGAVLVVHFGKLDIGLLRRAFGSTGLEWPKPKVVDTMDLIARLDRRRRMIEPSPRPTPTQLGQARAALGLPSYEEHHALYDALATAELFLLLRARLGIASG